jgi:hypothetical protein
VGFDYLRHDMPFGGALGENENRAATANPAEELCTECISTSTAYSIKDGTNNSQKGDFGGGAPPGIP